MKELSNWGRWGADDELGAANLITPAKRKQALALATQGLPISLAHDVAQEIAADAPSSWSVLSVMSPSGHNRSIPVYGHVSRRSSQPSGRRGLPCHG